ncbi:hypothetical protein COCOBI_02-6610 [Coccomyxa sp. Obi]|nr:hypothetical protein COCOBI_02-6610 [Coccomyxa sp. Obi]
MVTSEPIALVIGSTYSSGVLYIQDQAADTLSVVSVRVTEIIVSEGEQYAKVEAILPGETNPSPLKRLVFGEFLVAQGEDSRQVAREKYNALISCHALFAPVLDRRTAQEQGPARSGSAQAGSKRNAEEEHSSLRPAASGKRRSISRVEDGELEDEEETWATLTDREVTQEMISRVVKIHSVAEKAGCTIFPSAEEAKVEVKRVANAGVKAFKKPQGWSRTTDWPVDVIAMGFLDDSGILSRHADACGAGYMMLEEKSGWEKERDRICDEMGMCPELPFALIRALGKQLVLTCAKLSNSVAKFAESREHLNALHALAGRQLNQGAPPARAAGQASQPGQADPWYLGQGKPQAYGVCGFWWRHMQGKGAACDRPASCKFNHAMPGTPGFIKMTQAGGQAPPPPPPMNSNSVPLGGNRFSR